MNYRNLSDADLAEFAKNIVGKLTHGTVACFDVGLAHELAAALGSLCNELDANIDRCISLSADARAAFANKRGTRNAIFASLGTIHNYLGSLKGREADYESCGLTYRKSPSMVVAADPTDVSVIGSSNGVNTIIFRGNHVFASVVYEIYRRPDRSAPWVLIGTARKQAYADTPVTPGQFYEYKVRAVAARTRSNFSDVGVIYTAV